MIEIKDNCYKGTRILIGDYKRDMINLMINILKEQNFVEISIPIIQYETTFSNKVGEENNNMMYTFKDKGNRNLCLSPEYTAVLQNLTKTRFKYEKDLKLFYIQECFRGENPQAGRYRQFTQLGVEILNPSQNYMMLLQSMAMKMIHLTTDYGITINDFEMNTDVKRGLDYYKEGKGFEIICNKLGAQKQICGGGEYDRGVGFAIGIDRLLLLID